MLLLLLLNLLAFVFGLLVGIFYVVFRLNLLQVRRHHLSVIAFHWALTILAFAAAAHAWNLTADFTDAVAVVAAGSWLFNSWPSWGLGAPAPAHTLAHPESGHVSDNPQSKGIP
jgi:hypothetical protein